MFLRRKKTRKNEPSAPSGGAPPAASVTAPPAPSPAAPRHLGEIWHLLQEIAREEDPQFQEKSVVEHFNSCAEGQRDVQRWLEIYRNRLRPNPAFRMPAHHRRHRGYVLIPRNWPAGVRWEAFDDATLRRASVPGAEDEAELVRQIDELLLRSGGTEAAGQE